MHEECTSSEQPIPLVQKTSGVPDLEYFRKNIPIAEVARKLGLDVLGSAARCWRTDAHQHADRTPSVSLDSKTNRAKCNVCDDRSYSNIDLVIKVLGLSGEKQLRKAIRWIAENFQVPTIPKYRRLTPDKLPDVGRSGVDLIRDLLTSGILNKMHYSARLVILALVTLLDDSPRAISYAVLMRHAGVTSRSHVSEGIRHAQQMGLIEVTRSSREGPIRDVNTYKLTADSKMFIEQIRDCIRQQREQGELARAQQEARREARRSALRSQAGRATPAASAVTQRRAADTQVPFRTGSVPECKTPGIAPVSAKHFSEPRRVVRRLP